MASPRTRLSVGSLANGLWSPIGGPWHWEVELGAYSPGGKLFLSGDGAVMRPLKTAPKVSHERLVRLLRWLQAYLIPSRNV